jgi:hypothetical protein
MTNAKMNAKGYRAQLDMLHMTQLGAAVFFGVAPRTSRRWASFADDHLAPPLTVELLMAVMDHYKLTPEEVWKLAKHKPPRDGFGDKRTAE